MPDTLLARYFQGKNVENILDVCCGSGAFTAVLCKSIPQFRHLIGIDVNEEDLAIARTRFLQDERVRFCHGRTDDLQKHVGDFDFDVIALAKSLHHLEHPQQTLGMLRERISAQSYCVVLEQRRDVASEQEANHVQAHDFWAAAESFLGFTHRPTYTRHEILQLVSASGFSVVEEHNIRPPSELREQNTHEICLYTKDILDKLAQKPESEQLCLRGQDILKRLEHSGALKAPRVLLILKPSVP